MGTICGIWNVRGERVDFASLRALGGALCEKGARGEAYVRRCGGLWHEGGALALEAYEDGNVSVLLLVPDGEAIAPSAEAVRTAYREHGLGFFGHLYGPYALCILDERGEGRIILARDPAGRVPLSYAFCRGQLCFLSHPDRLFAVGLTPLPPDTCHVFSVRGYDRLRRLS